MHKCLRIAIRVDMFAGIYTETGMCTNMCVAVCVTIRIDMCVDICTDMCSHMCVDMRTDVCIDMRMLMHILAWMGKGVGLCMDMQQTRECVCVWTCISKCADMCRHVQCR